MPTKKPGRPRVDSEPIDARFPRDLLDALDAYILDLPVGTTRQEALRRIVRDWFEWKGYLPVPSTLADFGMAEPTVLTDEQGRSPIPNTPRE